MLLYVHIPFCDSKCHYCSFNSYVGRFDLRRRYMDALVRQLQKELQLLQPRCALFETLFIGGGTPSTVPADLYAPLFATLRPWLAPDAEITVEANPNSASPDWLEGMRELGVNRASFGVQSFDADKLRLLGRAHTPSQAKEAVRQAQKVGIERISVDLIYNVAGDDRDLIDRDLCEALSLPVEHISAYELTIEPDTPFARTPSVRLENDSLARYVARRLKDAGLPPYEVSNYSPKPSRHNLGYWQLKEYLGIGAGAVGYLGTSRRYPPASLEAYIEDPMRQRIEPIDADARRMERIFLGLRSIVGVEVRMLTPSMRQRADLLLQEGRLRSREGRLYNPDFFLADEIALFLID